MKIAPLLLAFSLAANAALGLFAVNRTTHWIDFASTAQPAPQPDAAATAAARSSALVAAGKIDPQLWTNVSGGEPREVAARLQAEGFPPSLQRAILAALIAEKFAARHKELAQLVSTQPWWYQLNGSPIGSKIIALRQQINREEKDALEQLLGADAGVTDYQRARRPRQYGDLPAGKMNEIERLNADYAELMQEVRNASQNILLPEDRAKLAFLEKEKRADLLKLLTPDELFEYDLRSSQSANVLRSQLTAFNPTEEEYRALFKLQSAFDAQYPSPELLTPEQRRERSEAQQKLTDQARSVLSPERFAEYQQKTDQAYIQTNSLVTRLQLPTTLTADLVAVQKEMMKRAQDTRSDRSLNAEQRNAQLGTLQNEAKVRVTALIGENNLPVYRQTAGSWFNYIVPPPAPPKK
jgi:hypothetical protein